MVKLGKVKNTLSLHPYALCVNCLRTGEGCEGSLHTFFDFFYLFCVLNDF